MANNSNGCSEGNSISRFAHNGKFKIDSPKLGGAGSSAKVLWILLRLEKYMSLRSLFCVSLPLRENLADSGSSPTSHKSMRYAYVHKTNKLSV
ncbi:hypothetical protein AG1IA_09580 [Rhizoctonia solani AG-1 IA]|uniref:Uncharacterized protein n=1 Tax=Thanatephorus cucumeris (strain AG1-IA) TaxID=983506 RepID=L8WDZ1_THACA|nr:hypothetical protein AG1IA_09580 [Rhizoctonia solani AG-1 IA]